MTLSDYLLQLNQSLSDLFPVGRVYGRLKVETVKGIGKPDQIDKDRPRRLPLTYDTAKRSNLPVLPDEVAGGLLFGITTGPGKPQPYEPGATTLFMEYPVALIGWYDTTKGQPTDWVIEQLQIRLAAQYPLVITGVEDQQAANVFRGIDYDFQNHPYLMHPFAGVRVDCLITLPVTNC
ncbi:hypothetical protein GGR92_005270 [Spirosoma lacussanchae]|uniref:hypothetical protein n=1 Tax=Spirosoma lacussanchae TaxID=1884249 RepID=UPI0011091398|nr:hypothetical protein [Spirosoma lacussanchae]